MGVRYSPNSQKNFTALPWLYWSEGFVSRKKNQGSLWRVGTLILTYPLFVESRKVGSCSGSFVVGTPEFWRGAWRRLLGYPRNDQLFLTTPFSTGVSYLLESPERDII